MQSWALKINLREHSWKVDAEFQWRRFHCVGEKHQMLGFDSQVALYQMCHSIWENNRMYSREPTFQSLKENQKEKLTNFQLIV